MSRDGVVRLRGVTASVKRKTHVHTTNGSTNLTWAVAHASAPLRLHARTSAALEKHWGVETEVTDEAVCADDLDIRVGDGLTLLSGSRIGQRFRVEASKPYDGSPGVAHRLLGLVLTTETFA